MKETYSTAISQVFKDEGGYTNESTDPGGPTNWGITIHDARQYWKPDATSEDVRNMPKSVAEDIYSKHYADPVHYDSLPAGVDYSVLDFAINSGISKSIKTLQEIVNVPIDGTIGPITLQATNAKDSKTLVEEIWDKRLAFDKSLTHLWPVYGRGWTARIDRGRVLALSMIKPTTELPSPVAVPSNWNALVDALINLFITIFKRK